MAKPLKVYVYRNCDTCRRALNFLKAHGVEHEAIPIRETPPTPAELRRMLQHLGGRVPKLFNSSGRDYRELGIKEKIGSMSIDEAISLLASNGNLIKRPFALTSSRGTVGFDEEVWRKTFLP